MNGLTAPLAALAGVASFASPCFLPIVPAFVGYLAGGAQARRRVAALALAFVLGFSAVFVGLWVSIGLVGYAAGEHRDLLRVLGGGVLVVMGLHVAGLVKVPLLDRQLRTPAAGTVARPATFRRSVVLGLAFGAGWTPCIGPILGGVLGLATTSGSVGEGALLLVAYSLGLGVPFVLVAVGAGEVSRRLHWFVRHHAAVSLTTGGVLVATGFLMITDLFGRLAGLVPALGL